MGPQETVFVVETPYILIAGKLIHSAHKTAEEANAKLQEQLSVSSPLLCNWTIAKVIDRLEVVSTSQLRHERCVIVEGE